MGCKGTSILLSILFMLAARQPVNAMRPKKLDMSTTYNSQKKVESNEMSSLSAEEAFERLKGIEFIINQKRMHKAISEAYKHRRREGIALALNSLTFPQREIRDGKLVDRTKDQFVAKKILEAFPRQSVGKLLVLYENGDPVTRGNVVRASGRLAGGKAIRKLLIGAIDDTVFIEEEGIEIDGIPLRVCDVAYNQLVLRYSIKNVLRTIGNFHTLDVRNYHIGKLKAILK